MPGNQQPNQELPNSHSFHSHGKQPWSIPIKADASIRKVPAPSARAPIPTTLSGSPCRVACGGDSPSTVRRRTGADFRNPAQDFCWSHGGSRSDHLFGKYLWILPNKIEPRLWGLFLSFPMHLSPRNGSCPVKNLRPRKRRKSQPASCALCATMGRCTA